MIVTLKQNFRKDQDAPRTCQAYASHCLFKIVLYLFNCSRIGLHRITVLIDKVVYCYSWYLEISVQPWHLICYTATSWLLSIRCFASLFLLVTYKLPLYSSIMWNWYTPVFFHIRDIASQMCTFCSQRNSTYIHIILIIIYCDRYYCLWYTCKLRKDTDDDAGLHRFKGLWARSDQNFHIY